MKLVIDIPEEVYKCVMDGTYCGTLYEELKNGVPVEPERKTGKWIRAIDPDVNAWTGGHTCSECGRACVQMSMNYCANCGAPMEVDDTINLEIGDFPHEKSDNNR